MSIQQKIDEKRYAAEMEAAGIAVLKYGSASVASEWSWRQRTEDRGQRRELPSFVFRPLS